MVALIAIMLATYGLSWSLVEADGPWNILNRFRHWVGVRYTEEGKRYGLTVVGDALNCPICTSYYVSVLMFILMLIDVRILYPLAAIGLVTIFTELTNGHS